MKVPEIPQTAPYNVKVEEGKTYDWCTCGQSRTQPYCDSSQAGSDWTSMAFRAKRTGTVYLCGCKHTKTPPYCDGSHLDLAKG